MTMPSDTPTPALTREQVEAKWERVRRPVDADATACGMDTWLCRFLRELNEHHTATMTERDTLRSEVEGLTPPEFTPIADSDGIFRKVYNGAMFETSEGNRYGVCMRDDTIEVIPVGDAPMPRVFPNQPATPQPPTAPEVCPRCGSSNPLHYDGECAFSMHRWHREAAMVDKPRSDFDDRNRPLRPPFLMISGGACRPHDTPPTSELPDSLATLSAHADEDRNSDTYKEQMHELTSELPEEESR